MKKILLGLIPALILAKTVSYDEALNEAFNNNNELKAKKLNIEIAKQDLKKAKMFNFGRLYFQETFSRTNNALYVFGNKLGQRRATFLDFGANEFTGSSALGVAPKNLNYPAFVDNFNTKIAYDLPIFTGFKIKYAKKIAALQVKAQKFKYQRDKNKLAIEVLKAYNGAVAAKYFIEALKSAKKTTTSFVKMTQDMYNQGVIVKSDVLSAEARDSEVDAKLIEAKNRYKLALAYLRFLTGNNEIDDVRGFKVIISPESDLKKLQQEALQNRNDIRYMKANVDTMKNKVKMDKNIYYPTIGAHLEYGQNNKNPELNRNKDYYLLSAQLTYNFLNPGAKEELQKSKILSSQTALYYKQMQNGIKMQVEQKLLNLQAKTEIIQAKLKNRDLAENVLHQYKTMYKNGIINISRLLLKQAEKQKADAELIKAKYDQAIAAAELELAIGKRIKGEDK
ncbi:MAG: TolC family protein [Nautilia sp.]|nr:MAG: TolC family protein [Nautilia sp.]